MADGRKSEAAGNLKWPVKAEGPLSTDAKSRPKKLKPSKIPDERVHIFGRVKKLD